MAQRALMLAGLMAQRALMLSGLMIDCDSDRVIVMRVIVMSVIESVSDECEWWDRLRESDEIVREES
jgi:hypothetical protein